MIQKFSFLALLVLILFAGCKKNTPTAADDSAGTGAPLFTLLPAATTGIDFRNDLVYDKDFNIYKYRNFYNGGGVGIGDVNNDGLPDVFFSSNMGKTGFT